MHLNIYTDGGFSYNHNIGSWAFIIMPNGDETRQITRYALVEHHKQTSQVAEMFAILKSFEFVYTSLCQSKDAAASRVHLTVMSDSRYCVDSIKDWMHRWAKQDWQVDKQNLDLWKQIYTLWSKFASVNMKWVKGHAGIPLNEQVDKLTQIPLEPFR